MVDGLISDAGSSSSAAASPATSDTFDATSGADGGVGGVGIGGGVGLGGGVGVGIGGDIERCLKNEDTALNWYDDAVNFGGVGGSVGVGGAFAPVEDIVRFAGAAASALPPLGAAAGAAVVTSDAIFDDFDDVGRDNFALTG